MDLSIGPLIGTLVGHYDPHGGAWGAVGIDDSFYDTNENSMNRDTTFGSGESPPR